MGKKIYFLFFLLGGLAIFSVFASNHLLSKNTLVTTITVSRAEGKPLPTPSSLSDQIRAGQEILKNSSPLAYTKKNIRRRIEILRQEIALAILDTQTGLVFEKRYWLEEADIKKGNATRRYYLENEENMPRFMPLNLDEEYRVTVNWWNNFNSDLSITKVGLPPEDDSRYVVIANKFLMDNNNLAYSEDQTGSQYSDIVYTPYSQTIHFPELAVTGKTFLDNHVDMAFERLRQLGVPSRAFPGKLVADVLSPQFVKNLFLVEQIDPQRIFLSEDGGLKLAERVFVRLGANQEKTFRYTFSKTGALGLGQIMPRTYASIVKAYPSAKLMKDIDIGRVDIQNGIMASSLTLDDHLAIVFVRMSKAEKNKFETKLKANPDFINEVRAAIYNGGPSKYRPATATISLQVRETVDFVRKYKMVRDLKLFE